MRRIVVFALLLFVVMSFCFADISTWEKGYYVDDFGDKTNHAYIQSDVVVISPSNYEWDKQYCYILIDSERVSFYFGKTSYRNWIIKTKTPDGLVSTYEGELDPCGRIYLESDSFDRLFIGDALTGCRVIANPDNIYAHEKYDFGTVYLPKYKLKEVQPDFI